MAVHGMEESDVDSFRNLIRAATDGGLQALYGGLLSPFTKYSEKEVHVGPFKVYLVSTDLHNAR